jgi:hypothetical protein
LAGQGDPARPLRGTAIASNLAFIFYGHIAGIEPVLILHITLLPINVIRLVEALGVSLPSVVSAAIRDDRHLEAEEFA